MSNPVNGSVGPVWVRQVVAGFGNFILGSFVFPATINVADPAALADGQGSTLSIDATGSLRTRISSVGSGIVFPVSPAILANSVGATGRVTTIGAVTTVATIAAGSLPAGTWDVQVFASFDLGAPVAATDTNNMQFLRGVTVVSVLQVLSVINIYSPVRLFRCVLDGATAVTVQSIGAGTAGVGYNAELVATRIA